MRFENREALTQHYHTEFHRTNLVLKSKGQQPLTLEQFTALQEKKAAEEAEKLAAMQPPQREPKKAGEEEDKEEFHYELCRDIPETECLFCGKTFDDADQCFEHMQNHGFRYCYPDKLKDKAGLMAYLSEKIGVGHCCIFCSKQFQSLRSCRQHMDTVKHCRYDFDEEVEEFYEEEKGLLPFDQGYIDSIGELHVGGKVYGNRKYAVYYRQKPTDLEALKKQSRRLAIAGPDGSRKSVDIAKDRVLRIREYYKQKYINKDQMRLVSRDYHPVSDIHRGNAV
jgi:pre-60S factor REI1